MMDRVGSRVWGEGTGAGNETVDDGIEIGIGAWGMSEAASGAPAPMFAAIVQGGRGGWARLNDEGEGSSTTKLSGIGCMLKEVEGGGLAGTITCWKREATVSRTIRVVIALWSIISFWMDCCEWVDAR